MTDLFLMILNMSIAASYAVIAVMVARLLLKRAPKIFSYILWSAVAIRLVIPVSFTSSFSLFRPVQSLAHTDTGFMAFVSQDAGMPFKSPVADAGIREFGSFAATTFPAAASISNTDLLSFILRIGSIVWITGAAILFFAGVASYLKVRSRVRTAIRVRDQVFETDQIATPFVFGILKPRIYIPTGLNERELSCILLHEQTHLNRRDYLIKLFAYMLLIVHWFNPLMWLSYALMSKDMEMSCDERVIGKLGDQMKRTYSMTLLSFAAGRSGLKMGSPLAFGESHVKSRIKNILAYRRPSSWMFGGSLLLVAALVVGCSTNPQPMQAIPQVSELSLYSGYDMEMLTNNKTQYVGNASKVGGLISGMPQPAGLVWNGMELQTSVEPYGVTVRYIVADSVDVSNDGSARSEIFYRNAILLLSLIDNVETISFVVDNRTGQYDGATYSTAVTREQAESMLGGDVRQYSADAASIKQLIDRLSGLSYAHFKEHSFQ